MNFFKKPAAPSYEEVTSLVPTVSMSEASALSAESMSIDEAEEQDLPKSFHEIYTIGKLLGSGGYGNVHQCHLKRDSRYSFAVKVVPEELYDPVEVELIDELEECPHITRVVALFHECDYIYIVMDEMKGGDLLERLHAMKGAPYSEENAKALFKTLLETLAFCHSRGIAHLDVKPENILLERKGDDTSMQLADWGLAQRFVESDGQRIPMQGQAGTYEYMSPELIALDDDVGYDERADIWSCGVVLYILVSGYQPFESDKLDVLCEQICYGNFEFHEHYWHNISKECKDLISSMLKVNPDERCSLEEALSSEWFRG